MKYELITVRKESTNPDILEIQYREVRSSFWLIETKSEIKNDFVHQPYHIWKFLKNGNDVNLTDELITINKTLQLNQTIQL